MSARSAPPNSSRGGRGGRDNDSNREGGGRSSGRGRGGRDSGGRGGGGRETPGLSGRNRHMGEVVSVQALLKLGGMQDRDILSVINPSDAERERNHFLDASSANFTQSSRTLPSHAEWRNNLKIGKALDPINQIVRSNHFSVDPRSIRTLYQYVVHIYRFNRDGSEATADCAADEDARVNVELLLELAKKHPEWQIGQQIGFTYNCRSTIYTSHQLPFGDMGHSEIINKKKIDGTVSASRFRVKITQTDTITMPSATIAAWRNVSDERTINALDSSLLSSARWTIAENSQEWFTVGSKAFRSNSEPHYLSPAYSAQRGYFIGLKTCMAGLVLVSDMSVSCFLNGGPLIEIMWTCGGYRSKAEMLSDANGRGIPRMRLDKIEEALKGAKVRITHLGHFRKIKSLGPPSDSEASTFSFEGLPHTVASYFVKMAKIAGSIYKRALPSGRLQFPKLPCINVGSNSRPILVPPEFIDIPGGQCRSKVCTPDMTAKMITHAAVRPDERMRYIMDGNNAEGSIVSVLRTDPTVAAFGLNGISKEPIATSAILLPPAKLKYGNGTAEPLLSGTWNMDGRKFSHPAAGKIGFGILLLGGSRPPSTDDYGVVSEFQSGLVRDAAAAGVTLSAMGPPLACGGDPDYISSNLSKMKAARIVVVVMMDDNCYGTVKKIADAMGLPTQCCKFKKISRLPRGYAQNIMLKINTKLGGSNHTLASRLAKPTAGLVFQDPPASIAWIFDKPCMLVGIDVSHGETSSSQESVAAVVASMDGRCSQYAAHISVQTAGQEIVASLTEAMTSLLQTFRLKNKNKMPSSIIVYRDGVGEGQFDQVTTLEMNAIRGAVELMGYLPDTVKIVIVVCQKGHHTRLVYEDRVVGSPMTYINPCPGLCIDATGGEKSIASGRLNEFYLNSHVAIQGTAKPCKYTLVHDEVGFKVCELEMLTYWLTYLYCRANKSVSYASPAYYAHWASKRGKTLCAAGCTAADLLQISQKWGSADMPSPMFFI